jgi:hypothetical protein
MVNANLKPIVRYGGGSIMIWEYFSSKGIGKLHIIEGIMDTIG